MRLNDSETATQGCSLKEVPLKCTPNPGSISVKNFIFCNVAGCRHATVLR